jgi:hypothetical protein
VKFERDRHWVSDEDSNEVRTFRNGAGKPAGVGRDFPVSGGTGGIASSAWKAGGGTASERKDGLGQLIRVNAERTVFNRDGSVYTHRLVCPGLSDASACWQ